LYLRSAEMITLSNISKSFGSTTALHDINMSVKQGEIIALIGPSGSGKTTLLKLLNGQHLPTSGSLKIDNREIAQLNPKELRALRAQIAYIPQDLGLVNSLKVYQNVLLGKVGSHNPLSMLRKFLFPKKKELEEVYAILETVGIPEKIYDTASTLSGGQQQRVAVARALYQKPHSILADEPVSAVDPARARNMVELLKSISEEQALTVIMSIHNLPLAQEFFPRIVGLRQGEVKIDSTSPDQSELEELFNLLDMPESDQIG